MTIVRSANSGDVQSIVRMGRAFWDAIPYNDGIPYCPDSLAMTCGQMISQGLLIYAHDGAEPVGAVGALCSPLFVNRDKLMAAELFWWVQPEYRNSGVGIQMVARLEEAARKAGVHRLSMMAVEGLEIDKAAAMYERFGYSPAERTWSKALWL